MTRLPLLLILACLAACASAPRVNYYVLAPFAQASAPLSPPSQALLSVRLAGYLSSQNIVYRESPVQVSQAQFHQWAEAPAQLIQRSLAAHLAALPVTWLAQARGRALPQLHIEVDAFNGSSSGYARLAGRYALYDAGGKLQWIQPFDVQVAQHGDGYPALAQALSEAVATLASQMAPQLARERTLLPVRSAS